MNLLLALFGALATSLGGTPERPPYAEGQVWEYSTRPQDTGSLIKIHKIEQGSNEIIYHISVVGVRIGAGNEPTGLSHLPVSRQTLDKSVTRLTTSTIEFPDPDEGIAIWRAENGGVFSITLAEIVDIAESSIPQAEQ